MFKTFIRIFVITFSVCVLILFTKGWAFNEFMIWEALRYGLLSASIFLVNILIADHVAISWVEQPIKRLLVSSVLTIIGTLIVSTISMKFLTLLQYGEFKSIGLAFYWSVLLITFFISLFMHGRQFLLEQKQSIEEKEAFKRAHLSSRLESLQNQVNPHFLFNSLNVLTNLVHKDADLSVQFIRQMSHVYRYILDHQQEELVPLLQEKEMLEAYLFLLKIRFGDSLKYDMNIENDMDDLIPPLSLQMLVENAIKHNIVSKKRPLIIVIKRDGNTIVVKNNLQLKQQEHNSLGIGLDNIKERYSFIGQNEVKITQTNDYFKVVLPIFKLKR